MAEQKATNITYHEGNVTREERVANMIAENKKVLQPIGYI